MGRLLWTLPVCFILLVCLILQGQRGSREAIPLGPTGEVVMVSQPRPIFEGTDLAVSRSWPAWP